MTEYKMSSNIIKPIRAKSLPMIVDVAVDPQGKTLYRLHETKQQIQEPTPVSSNYSESARFLFDSIEGLYSPAGTDSSSQLPCAEKPRKSASSFSCASDCATEENNKRRASETSADKYSLAPSDDIWSSDVEVAFEEALSIVPKCGLTKIKIAGKCCGRNELIADFILAKTGKFRSRKQVSSHIQVVKNMKLKDDIIKLINDGPGFNSPEEAEENMQRFEEVFSKININKSLGLNSTGNSELLGSGGLLRRRASEQLALPPKRRKLPALIISVRNISFTIDAGAIGDAPVALTRQEEAPMKFLSIKENANITARFPGLEEFANTNVPLIHNMVNMLNPLCLATADSIDVGLKTNFNIEIPGPTKNLSSFTTVYSFGEEVMKVNEENFQIDKDQPFLVKFWKCFFLQLVNLPTSLDTAFKGVTVKQVIYDNSVPVASILPKSKIRAVLLWEFSKVDDISAAVASSSRLFLPPTLGYATMTADNSSYSMRSQQPTYTTSKISFESSENQFSYTPSSSSSSLKNLSNNQNYELPDAARNHDFSHLPQLLFPDASLASAFLDQQQPTPLHLATATYPPLSTSLDGDSTRFFPQDEQHFWGNYFH